MSTNLIQEGLNSTALIATNNQNQNVNVGSEVNIPKAIEPLIIINKTEVMDGVYGMTRFANPVTRDRFSAAVISI